MNNHQPKDLSKAPAKHHIMAPARRTAGASNEDPVKLIQDLATANAEIERLRALLASQETPSGTKTLSPDSVGKIERLTVRLAGSLVAAGHKAVKGRSLRHYVRLKLHKAV